MGYRCPVCTHPQTDGKHLANHLAFTALIRGGEHEAWLDEHVPDWEDMGEETLATRVRADVPAVELPSEFETDSHHGGQFDQHSKQVERGHLRTDPEHGHPSTDHEHGHSGSDVPPPTDEETQALLEQARELTRKRRQDDDEEP